MFVAGAIAERARGCYWLAGGVPEEYADALDREAERLAQLAGEVRAA